MNVVVIDSVEANVRRDVSLVRRARAIWQHVISTVCYQRSGELALADQTPFRACCMRAAQLRSGRVEGWSTRTLAQKIDGMLFERTALSKKPEKLIRKELAALREKGEVTPALILQDPYMLDFLELAEAAPATAQRMIDSASQAAAYRKSFAFYNEQRLLVSIMFYGSAAMLFLGAFVVRYKLELILSFPLIALVMALYRSIAFAGRFTSSTV